MSGYVKRPAKRVDNSHHTHWIFNEYGGFVFLSCLQEGEPKTIGRAYMKIDTVCWYTYTNVLLCVYEIDTACWYICTNVLLYKLDC